jgi:hypothetical protein
MTDEFKVQWSVSLPPAAQYAKGDMLNIRGNTVAEVEAMFDEVLRPDSEFVQKASEVATTLRLAAVVTDGLAGPPAASQEPPVTVAAGPVAEVVRMCSHGKRTRREGNSARGQWVGWFCPLPKGDPNQCKPDFEN